MTVKAFWVASALPAFGVCGVIWSIKWFAWLMATTGWLSFSLCVCLLMHWCRKLVLLHQKFGCPFARHMSQVLRCCLNDGSCSPFCFCHLVNFHWQIKWIMSFAKAYLRKPGAKSCLSSSSSCYKCPSTQREYIEVGESRWLSLLKYLETLNHQVIYCTNNNALLARERQTTRV